MLSLIKYLDNPAWYALTGPLADIALCEGDARCYPPGISPFAAVGGSDDAQAFNSLAHLVEPGRVVGLVGSPPRELPAEWLLLGLYPAVQMVCDTPVSAPVHRDSAIMALTPADVPAMLRLIELTEPGPFLPRSIELGPYLSIQHDGELVAMAGVRLHPPGCREISAVCTHPDYRRRGYSKLLVTTLMHDIQRAGDVPFLHVRGDNDGAIALYESLGFVRRTELHVFALQRQ